MKKMEKLDINLYGNTIEEFERQKKEYIDRKTKEYEEDGIFEGRERAQALLGAEEIFPSYKDWLEETTLTTRGQQRVIDKINEIIEAINLLRRQNETTTR